MKLLGLLGICAGSLPGYVEKANAQQHPITAINIALDPDATMIRHAEAANAGLLKDYPKGFAFDASHRPHITLLQRYVLTENLDKIYTAVGKVVNGMEVADWKLKASRYYLTPSGNNQGVLSLIVESTDDLLKLQQKLIEAVAPFTVKTGTAEAFFTTADDRSIKPSTIEYVAGFIPNQTGSNFDPHVTLGVASEDYLKRMIAEPFETFMFSPIGVSVYQLGNFGTARKKLKGWGTGP